MSTAGSVDAQGEQGEQVIAIRFDPASVACPRCTSAPGERCRWELGVYAAGEYHAERRRAEHAGKPRLG